LGKNSVSRYLRFQFKTLALAYSESLVLILVDVCAGFAEVKHFCLYYIKEDNYKCCLVTKLNYQDL
jgi:hypothetical protein